MKLLIGCILSLTLLIIGAGCSSSGTISEVGDTKIAPSIYPVWYNNAGYIADSTSFHGFGTAVSADSITAIKKASEQARIILEAEIAKITETIRQDLVESGSNAAKNTDFIIILRTAHSLIQKEADSALEIARNNDGIFRGFASVSITKKEVVATLENGFNGHPRYWGEFSGSTGFQANFK